MRYRNFHKNISFCLLRHNEFYVTYNWIYHFFYYDVGNRIYTFLIFKIQKGNSFYDVNTFLDNIKNFTYPAEIEQYLCNGSGA